MSYFQSVMSKHYGKTLRTDAFTNFSLRFDAKFSEGNTASVVRVDVHAERVQNVSYAGKKFQDWGCLLGGR